MPLLYGTFCVILLSSLVIILTPIFRSKDFSLKQRYQMAGSVFIFFFAVMFAIYYKVGAPEVMSLSMEREQKITLVRNAIGVLSQRVKDNPEDAGAWIGLGESFMLTGQYKGAVNAYKQAVKLTQGNPKAILAYAQSMITEANGNVTDEAKKSLEMVVMLEPKNPEARYLLAVRNLQEGKTEEAMKSMRELYYSLPDDAPVKELIDRQIGNKR